MTLSDREHRALAAAVAACAVTPSGDAAVDALGPLLARIPPSDLHGLRHFLAALESGLLDGRRYSARTPHDAADALRRISGSRIFLLREAAAAVRALALLGHYGTPEGWRAAGYDGPWLGRIDVPVQRTPEMPPPRHARDLGDVVRTRVCVIGSGAGGSAAAAVLAARGIDTAVLEAGDAFTARDADQHELHMLPRLYADAGLRTTADRAIGILQGRGLGGSTLHNTGLVVAAPEALIDHWRDAHGFPFDAMTWDARVDAVIRMLRAVPVPEDAINPSNDALRRGASALGWSHRVALHNRSACSGCGYCMLGCAYDRKWNASLTFLPQAADAGARIVCGATVVGLERGGAGWRVHVARDDGRRSLVDCERVVLAAGALESPALLRASRLGNRCVGRGLRLHPTPLVYAAFDEPITPWRGVPQSILVDEFAAFARGRRGGFLLLASAATQPALAAAALPGWGTRHRARITRLGHTAIAGVLLHDEGAGRVGTTRGGHPRAFYRLSTEDRVEAERGIAALADVLLAAGAQRVTLPFMDAPDATDMNDVWHILEHADWSPRRVLLNAVHPQGTVAIGADESSAADPYGGVRDAPGIHVCDASAFPTSVGVPPQVTVMALAAAIADHVASDLS